jgi:hypothetical protein
LKDKVRVLALEGDEACELIAGKNISSVNDVKWNAAQHNPSESLGNEITC